MLCLTAVSFVACEDDENLNSRSGVSVSIEKLEYKVKENKRLFNIPIIVTEAEGTSRNGNINVDVEVTPYDEDCVENVHYIVTSKHIIIPASKKRANIEIKIVDDRKINEDRKFFVRITSAKGAEIIADKCSTKITLLDNDDIPYDRMEGKWLVRVKDLIDENAVDSVWWETNLSIVPDESEEGYGSIITMAPWRMWNGETYEGMLDIKHTLMFKYDNRSQQASLELKLGQIMASGFVLGGEDENGNDLTSCSLMSVTPTATGHTTNGTVLGTVSPDFEQITFNLPVMGLLRDARDVPFSYWFGYEGIVMTRIK